MPRPARTNVTVHARRASIRRFLQRWCSSAHAISHAAAANVVRPLTPPAGAYTVGAAKIPASLTRTKKPIANAPMPAARNEARAGPFAESPSPATASRGAAVGMTGLLLLERSDLVDEDA